MSCLVLRIQVKQWKKLKRQRLISDVTNWLSILLRATIHMNYPWKTPVRSASPLYPCQKRSKHSRLLDSAKAHSGYVALDPLQKESLTISKAKAELTILPRLPEALGLTDVGEVADKLCPSMGCQPSQY